MLVFNNVDQSNPRYVPVNDTDYGSLGMPSASVPSLFCPCCECFGDHKAFPWCTCSFSSPSQCGAEQRCSAEGIWFQVHWATESILWPFQAICLPLGNCNWFSSSLYPKTML